MNITLKNFFYWAIGGLALIALADPFPDLATLFVVILMVGVLLTHFSDFTGFINSNTPQSVQNQGGTIH